VRQIDSPFPVWSELLFPIVTENFQTEITSKIMIYKLINNLLDIGNQTIFQIIICLCFLFACNQLKAQQEIMYSQYMYNMININPAFAGNSVNDNITALYRKQWVNVAGSPTTYSVSWDRGMNENDDDDLGLVQKSNLPVGYGLQIYKDQLGIETSQGIQAFYSFRIRFNESVLSLGLSGGVMNYRALFSQVSTVTGGDPLFQEDVSVIVPTSGVGVLYSTRNWYVGLSAPSLLQTKILDIKQQIVNGSNTHYFLNGGYVFKVSNDLMLKPSLMLKSINAINLQYDINFNAWIQNSVGLGVSYRSNDALVGMFSIMATPQITIGYAYDYLISNMTHFSTGSHELILNYQFNKTKKSHILSPRYF